MAELMTRINRAKGPEDGGGWLLDYVCRLQQAFPQYTEEFVWDVLPMAKGWAYYGWAMENDGWLQFSGLKRTSKGYIAQEVEMLVEQAHAAWNKTE